MSHSNIENKTHNIYIITNDLNEKEYIGCTSKSVEERFRGHIVHAKWRYDIKIIESKINPLYQDIRKFGEENFSVQYLESADSKTEGVRIESEWISDLNTFEGRGYNRNKGGTGFSGPDHPLFGKPRSAEVKQKLREANLGTNSGEDHHLAKLTAEQALDIKQRAINGSELQKEIASDYEISRPNVSAIKSGRNWSHIDLEAEDPIAYYN